MRPGAVCRFALQSCVPPRRTVPPHGRTVRPGFPPAPDTLQGDGRGLGRAHLLYSAPGALGPVRCDCERTLVGDGWRRRRSGPSRTADGETTDDVTSVLEHSAVSDQARRAATSLPIELRPPPRYSSGGGHWALADTRRPSVPSGAQATRAPTRPSRDAPLRRRCRARPVTARTGPLVPAPLPMPVAWRLRRRHA